MPSGTWKHMKTPDFIGHIVIYFDCIQTLFLELMIYKLFLNDISISSSRWVLRMSNARLVKSRIFQN